MFLFTRKYAVVSFFQMAGLHSPPVALGLHPFHRFLKNERNISYMSRSCLLFYIRPLGLYIELFSFDVFVKDRLYSTIIFQLFQCCIDSIFQCCVVLGYGDSVILCYILCIQDL